MLVLVNHNRITLALRNCYRNDLARQTTIVLGSDSLVL